MTKRLNGLVEPKNEELIESEVTPIETAEQRTKRLEKEQRVLEFIKLINQLRNTSSKIEQDRIFEQIEKLMQTKIYQLLYKMRIPGNRFDDLYQEALIALRFKAIKGYDEKKSKKNKLSPFDSFAVLCIRRHLSTKLKASFQSKQRALNGAISLDQDRSHGSSQEESVMLSDIIASKKPDASTFLREREDYTNVSKALWKEMSERERDVYRLYKQDLSYEEIAMRVFCLKLSEVTKEHKKSVDNSLSRIKTKAKCIYRQYNKE